MREVKKMLRDLSRGVNVEKNLSRYADTFVDTCYHEAVLKLTFSAYLLYEQKADDEEGMWDFPDAVKWFGETESLLRRLLELADEPYSAEAYGELAERAKMMHGQIKAVMEVYTSYVDCLNCYIYVLDRMRFRYEEEAVQQRQMNDINEDQFIHHLMCFLFEPDETSVRAERMRDVIREIPVYMTKNKLFSHITQTLSTYVGSERISLERYLYILRSVSMLNRPDESVISENHLGSWIRQLFHTDFSTLDKDGWMEIQNRLEEEIEWLQKATDLYAQLQEIVNEVCALCLIGRHTQKETDVYADCMEILRDVAQSSFPEEKLEGLEGKIEHYVEISYYLSSSLPEIKNVSPDGGGSAASVMDYDEFVMISDLLSDSLFIDLQREEGEGEILDEKMVNEAARQFTDQLSQLFAEVPKEVKRSVMSLLLAELPPIFQNAEEFMTYATTNLFGCQNIAERKAAVSSLAHLMAEEELFDMDWSDPDDLLV